MGNAALGADFLGKVGPIRIHTTTGSCRTGEWRAAR